MGHWWLWLYGVSSNDKCHRHSDLFHCNDVRIFSGVLREVLLCMLFDVYHIEGIGYRQHQRYPCILQRCRVFSLLCAFCFFSSSFLSSSLVGCAAWGAKLIRLHNGLSSTVIKHQEDMNIVQIQFIAYRHNGTDSDIFKFITDHIQISPHPWTTIQFVEHLSTSPQTYIRDTS